MSIFYLSFFLILSMISFIHCGNKYPVIGVLTQPADFPSMGYTGSNWSYIADGYIKSLEASGARVIPIRYDSPKYVLDNLLNQVNGLFFCGGNISLGDTSPSIYGGVGKYLIEAAIKKNEAGDYFPIWGTCLGYELIMKVFSNYWGLLVPVTNGFNVSKPLKLVPNLSNSKIFSNVNKDLLNAITNYNNSFFEHKVTPNYTKLSTNAYIKGNFTLTTFTYSNSSYAYIASVEGINHPYYGVQFHSEKASFTWPPKSAIPHTKEAQQWNQYLFNFFVNETKKNNHTMPDEVWRKLSIFNINPIHYKATEYEQIYLFPAYSQQSLQFVIRIN